MIAVNVKINRKKDKKRNQRSLAKNKKSILLFTCCSNIVVD